MKKYFVFVVAVISVFVAGPVVAATPGGGINTVEGFYPMDTTSPLDIITGYEYDIVATAYGEPGEHISMNIMGPSLSEVPWASKGTITYMEFSDLQNEWVLGIDSDETGTAEVVIHMPRPVNPDFIRISVYPVGKNWDFWYAKVSTHQVFLPLILKQ